MHELSKIYADVISSYITITILIQLEIDEYTHYLPGCGLTVL